jgi:hypothetical protein
MDLNVGLSAIRLQLKVKVYPVIELHFMIKEFAQVERPLYNSLSSFALYI